MKMPDDREVLCVEETLRPASLPMPPGPDVVGGLVRQ